MKTNVNIYISSKNSEKRIHPVNIEKLTEPNINNNSLVKINKSTERQTLLGFGGSFTEASSSIYSGLDKDKKEEIIEAYFGSSGNLSLIHI